MFSFAKTAAVSAIFLSASLGVAFAGSHGAPSHDRGGQQHEGRHDERSLPFGDYSDMDDDQPPSPSVIVPAYTYAHVARPHLATILAELRTDNQSMNADKARGLLTGGEYRHLKAEDMRIRREAIGVADRNHGAIPESRYTALQNQAHQLQADISRMA